MQAALTDFETALRLNPELAEAYGTRGLLYHQLGNSQQAMEDLQRAATLFNERGDQQGYQMTLGFIDQIQQDMEAQP